jgi:hypothetical protein
MSVLMIGCDKGSWEMRGRQLGAAIDAAFTKKPGAEHWQHKGPIVLVKRAPFTWYREARAVRSPLIWDALDFWHQPSGNAKTEQELLQSVFEIRDGLHIGTLIGATRAMATAIGGVYLPHHCRIGLRPTPSRERLRVVGYDGAPRYLGSWKDAIDRACAKLGMTFVINPEDLSTVDALVAFRGEEYDGWACRQWKSGVKYVNAIAAGRPVLTQTTAAFTEINPPGGRIVDDPLQLEEALASLAPAAVRRQVYQECRHRSREFTLETIAKQYRAILQPLIEGTHV